MSPLIRNRIYSSFRMISGFTLIDLLVVISVVLKLSRIALGISRGVQHLQACVQAKAVLTVIAQGFELFNALCSDCSWIPFRLRFCAKQYIFSRSLR